MLTLATVPVRGFARSPGGTRKAMRGCRRILNDAITFRQGGDVFNFTAWYDEGMDEPPLTLADSLSGVCGDLLSFEKFEAFVHRLFATAAGSWQNVAQLCVGLPELPSHSAELFSAHADALAVT